MISNFKYFLPIILLAACNGLYAQSVKSLGDRSPAINQAGDKSTVIINYDKERIGKKIAIREAYLIPMDSFAERECQVSDSCMGFYESVSLYIKVQSIWPEPILLTAARLDLNKFQTKWPRPGGLGRNTLGERITSQFEPGDFFLRPGEIKLIRLEKGIRLTGVMDFFTEELRGEPFGDTAPGFINNLHRVVELNDFFAKKYGRRASLILTIYEKDYRPLLVTSFLLSDGDNLFGAGDERNSKYKLKHDAFIAEVLYRLNGGKRSFDKRFYGNN